MATPKLRYPFDRHGAFHFPSVKQIDIYEKIDGTNIVAYQFKDAQDNSHVTCIAGVSEELNFRNLVLEAYDKIGIRLAEDKAFVMRKLSTEFPRPLMKKSLYPDFEVWGCTNLTMILDFGSAFYMRLLDARQRYREGWFLGGVH